jgi:hypothetical protein
MSTTTLEQHTQITDSHEWVCTLPECDGYHHWWEISS